MNLTITDVKQQAVTLQDAGMSGTKQQGKVSEEPANVSQEASYEAVSCQGDTLSISEAGRTADAQKDVLELQTADGTVVKKEAEETAAESDSNSTVNLSSYTETELKQMYLSGDITKIEYEEELSSRGIIEDNG